MKPEIKSQGEAAHKDPLDGVTFETRFNIYQEKGREVWARERKQNRFGVSYFLGALSAKDMMACRAKALRFGSSLDGKYVVVRLPMRAALLIGAVLDLPRDPKVSDQTKKRNTV